MSRLPGHRLDALRSATLRIAVEPLGQVPNSGLLLPVVSPDGQWLAAMNVPEDAAVYVDDLFTGRGLEPVQLVLMPTANTSQQQTVVSRGAAWPAWSTDGSRLAAVSYAATNQPRLVVHHRNTGETEMLAPGFRGILSPSFSPDGQWLAFAAHGPEATGSRIFVLDLDRRTSQMAPASTDGTDLVFPLWVDHQNLIYFAVDDTAVTIQRWTLGESQVRLITQLEIASPSIRNVFQAMTNVAEPLSPDGRRLVYHEADGERLVTVDLDTGQRHALPAESMAGCWLTPTLLAVATANDLLLAFPADRSPPRELTRGQTLPLWTDAHAGELLFLSPGSSPWSFQLVRLHFVPAP